MLLELMERMESVFPAMETMIFGSESLGDELSGSAEGMLITDLSRLSEADILILLSEPSDEDDNIKNFDGTIIDFAGYEFPPEAEVLKAYEPVKAILKNIAVPPEDVSAVVQLPACVFGKDGVEDLMRQTRDIFSFENGDNLVFTDRIAFNIHFGPLGLAGFAAGKTLDDFAEAGGDVSVRLYPLSTVFTVDLYAADVFDLKSEEGYAVPSGFFMASDVSESSEIFVIRRRNGFTFVGDYIHSSVEAVMKKLMEVAGQ